MTSKTKGLSLRELKKIQKEAKRACFIVGDFLTKKQKRLGSLKVSHKEAQGLVSNADIDAEKKLIRYLSPLLPHAFFLAEESAFQEFGNQKSFYLEFKKKEYSWIIDPLDGTTNFLSGMDYYCICLCLVHFGKPILSVIYRPGTDEMYSAIAGHGSYIEKAGKKKKISLAESPRKLKDTLLVTGFACEKGEEFDQEFELFQKMMSKGRGIRRMGSAALDICLVAQGIFGGFWERGLAPWDVAAASLIVQEAGGKVTDYEGRAFNPFQASIVACPSVLHRQMLTAIKA